MQSKDVFGRNKNKLVSMRIGENEGKSNLPSASYPNSNQTSSNDNIPTLGVSQAHHPVLICCASTHCACGRDLRHLQQELFEPPSSVPLANMPVCTGVHIYFSFYKHCANWY